WVALDRIGKRTNRLERLAQRHEGIAQLMANVSDVGGGTAHAVGGLTQRRGRRTELGIVECRFDPLRGAAQLNEQHVQRTVVGAQLAGQLSDRPERLAKVRGGIEKSRFESREAGENVDHSLLDALQSRGNGGHVVPWDRKGKLRRGVARLVEEVG